MRTIKKCLLMASLLLVTTAASAQCVKLEKRMNNLIFEYSEELCISKTINEMRDPSKPERPLQSKCEVYYFTIKKLYNRWSKIFPLSIWNYLWLLCFRIYVSHS